MGQKEVRLKFKVMTSCARDVGIKPGKKWSSSQRKKVDACVAKKTRSR